MISLTAGSVISLTQGLTLTSDITITTTAACGSDAQNPGMPPIQIVGVGASSGNGITTGANNHLNNLWIRQFSGTQLVSPLGASAVLKCVRASKS